jgi:PPOX class probable F420-dependent enzyme
MDERGMRDRLAAARVGTLATIGRSGAPTLVPFVFVLDGDRIYTAVDHKPKRTQRLERFANVSREPRVSVLVDHYEEDWSRLWWVRADGRAVEVTDRPEAERAIDLLAGKYRQYRDRRPDGAVMRIDVETWRGWSASE